MSASSQSRERMIGTAACFIATKVRRFPRVNPSSRANPHSVWNQFGGSVGGPILKNRFFFFFAYEGYRQRSTTTLVNDVPTPLLRNTMLLALPFPETKINLDYFTLPNQPYAPDALVGRWIGPGLSNQNDNHFDARLDYLIGGGNLSVTF